MILMNDFKAEPIEIREAMLAATKRVFDSGWYVLGKEVENFEKEWSVACGVERAVGVANGMDAIEIGLRALGIGPGDEVITTAMTAFATVLAVLRAGATPVLADIDPDSGLLCIDSARRCLSKKTKAILLVHLYGQIRNMDEWISLCDKSDIYLIEDCAQAHLAKWKGRVAGSFGVVGAYSFYPTKNLGAIGDGGILVTNDSALAERAARLRNYGQSVRYHHPDIGMNSRLDEIQAAILSERLKWLPGHTQRRQEIACRYRRDIKNPLVRMLSVAHEEKSHVYHLFVITCLMREQLKNHLEKKGVQSLIHYPIPLHHQQPCKDVLRDPEGLQESERHAETCLSLPCHPYMSNEDVVAVIEAVNLFEAEATS
jgi:dTDP-4-amino-4,6-dideoxygalactose transaminase